MQLYALLLSLSELHKKLESETVTCVQVVEIYEDPKVLKKFISRNDANLELEAQRDTKQKKAVGPPQFHPQEAGW